MRQAISRNGRRADKLRAVLSRRRAVLLEALERRTLLSGTWTALANAAPGQVGTMLLLPDGTVMATTNGAGPGSDWARLTPSASGGYINGTWTKLANANDTRLYDASVVLQNGSVFVAGGEYGTGGSTGEIYNPLTNTWTRAPSQNFGTFSDSYGSLIANGNVLVAPVGPNPSGYTTIYNPTTNSWSQGPKIIHGGSTDEQSWVKLADGSLLTVGGGGSQSERYIPATNTFVNDATLPVALSDSLGEYGPGFLLPSGEAIFFGASGHSAIYAPSGTTSPGSWVAGPDIPGGLGEDDAAGVSLSDGTIIITAGPIDSYNGPTTLFLYDPVANTLSPFAGPNTYSGPPFVTRFLALPNSDVLYSENGSILYEYSPGVTPLAAAVPTISSVTHNADGTMTLTGTNLNGIDVGASYGDDAQMDSNYPVIRLTSGSNVYYARSYNWTNNGVQLGSTSESVTFTLPLGIPAGTYSLVLTANGVPSTATSLTVSTTANNLAPTIATAAAANPAAPTGTTAALSVLGADDAGEGNLVYTWVNTKAPGGASLASFSINGTNAAKNTTVTFHRAGSYTFVVTATDAGGLSTTSTVTVNVVATLAAVTISPSPANVTTGKTQQLTATALDQFGITLPTQPTFTWTVTSGGGTVSTTGLYTPPATGTLATVTAAAGGFQASTTVGVVNAPWTSVDIGGPGIAGLAYDSATTTTVRGSGGDIWNQSDQFHFDYQTFAGDNGIIARINALPTLNTDGSQSFAAKAGVMFRDSTAANASFVDLVYTNGIGLQLLYRNGTGATAAQQGSSLNVSGPIYVKLVRAGTTYTAYYSTDGNNWTTVGSYTNASIGSNALVGIVACSHDNNKLATVTYSHVGFTYAQTLTSLTLAPTPDNLTTGQTQQLVATALDQFGNPMSTQPTITWTVTPGGGTVSSSGLYTAPSNAGTLDTVTASAGGLQATATIGVVKSPWTSIDIGGPGIAGIAYDSASTTTVQGSGGDIWNNADQFHFDYQTVGGDSVVIARIDALPTLDTDGSQSFAAKAGVMFRDSSSATASFVDLVYTNGIGLQLLYRNGTATTAAQQGPNVTVSGPLYVKLTRVGSTFTGAYSSDGSTWTTVGTYADASIASNALVGIVSCSHDNTKVANVTYSHVVISQPTVATAAAASPVAVLGATTNLSVLGANLPNAAGESSLTYTWAVTAKSNGAATPTFGVNGTNGAKNTVATFTTPGTYTFTVTIADAYGQSVTSATSVTVTSSLAAISVAAGGATVVGGQSAQVNAFDQFGQLYGSAINWSVDAGAGTIDGNGLFTAGQNGGVFTITAVSGGVTKTTSVAVVPSVYTGGAGADTYAIRLSPNDSTLEQISVYVSQNVIQTYTLALSRFTSLRFAPTGGDGTLTVDFTNGNPIPSGGISYTGGPNAAAGGNVLRVAGAPGGSSAFSINGTQVTSASAPSSPIAYLSIQGVELLLPGANNVVTQTASPSAPVTFNGGTGSSVTLNVNAGAFNFTGGTVVSGDVAVVVQGGAAVSFNADTRLTGLSLNDAVASVGGTSAITLAGPLVITGSGTLDLGAGSLLLPSSPSLAAYIAQAAGTVRPGGYNAWDGSGLTSSVVKADAANNNARALALGYFDSRENATTGLNLAAGKTLVKYTVYGDATGDGVDDTADFTVWRNNAFTGTRWSQGDFNYDGAVDTADFTIWRNNFFKSANGAAAAAASPVQSAATMVTASEVPPAIPSVAAGSTSETPEAVTAADIAVKSGPLSGPARKDATLHRRVTGTRVLPSVRVVTPSQNASPRAAPGAFNLRPITGPADARVSSLAAGVTGLDWYEPPRRRESRGASATLVAD